MAKQIIVTQNDYGIELETQFVDDKKKPLDITDYDVRVKIIYDDKTIDTVLAEHKDSINGIAYIVLEKEHLINAGLHTSVWSVVDEDEHVTAQENVYYFVKDVEGSEDDTPTTDLPIDADGVLDKFNEIDNNLFELTEQGNVVSETLSVVNEQLDNMTKYSSINVVTQIGLDNTGILEIGDKLQTFIDNYSGDRLNLYFPNGNYRWNTTVTTSKTICINGEKSNVVINNSGDLACLKHNGSCTISGLIFETTSSNRTEFTVYSTNGSEFFIYDTVFTCSCGKINGLSIENTTISIIDRCKFNHSQISLKTWDCKITNTWVWALWRDYGIGIHGGSGNINMSNVDIVPPFRTENGDKNGSIINGQKAGIWINSLNGNPTSNIIMENVYFDGNANLDTCEGLLCENSFAITLSSYRSNLMNSTPIIIDSCYNVIISKGMHYGNNKYDQQANEILIRKTTQNKHGNIVIDCCHFLNFNDNITVPTSAIKIDTTANLSTILTNNTISQNGNGSAYGDKEIEFDENAVPFMLYTNNGTKTLYRISGSITYSGTGITINTPIPLAYTPKQKDYSFSADNDFTPNFRVQQINNYQAYIASEESSSEKTLYYDIKLGS